MDKGNYLSGADNYDGWYQIVAIWIRAYGIQDQATLAAITPLSDVMIAIELAVTIKAEVLNFLDNESGTRTIYAINKHFRLTGPVA